MLIGHYVNILFFDADVVAELESDFLALCSRATAITGTSRQGISRRQRLAESICRMLAPLLQRVDMEVADVS